MIMKLKISIINDAEITKFNNSWLELLISIIKDTGITKFNNLWYWNYKG